MIKKPPAMQEPQETRVQFLGGEDPLEEGMAAHSSILAQIIPWTEEPGGLQSMGSQSQIQVRGLSMHAPISLALELKKEKKKGAVKSHITTSLRLFSH